MVKVDQVVSWIYRGRRLKGIVRAVVEPGEDALQKCPHLQFTPEARAHFRHVSDVRRVLIESHRDSPNGRRHYARFYMPPLSAIERGEASG